MERYSTLWGTMQEGPYGRLGSSKSLNGFLTQKIGAANIKDVVELTEKLVTGITMLTGYEKEPLVNKPVAVVYAPLYLQKKAGMAKGMKGFCALAISGMEHRETRDSSYSHTYFFPREEMLDKNRYNFLKLVEEEEQLNYLDMLMGTHLTTYNDVAQHRSGIHPVDFERQPSKITPVLTQGDWAYVAATIDALYRKKNVVLVLERGVDFNTRSMALLTQIYSMLSPMMATETGFATYQPVKRILELSADTNVQIYVVPAGMELNGLAPAKFEILDLSKPRAQEPSTPVIEVLMGWTAYDWKQRISAMAHLFGKIEEYSNADQFVKTSREFFEQARAFEAWYNDTSKHKTLTSIAQIQAEDKTDTEWNLVPWAKELFRKKYPYLVKEGSVGILNARNVAEFYEYNGTDEDLKKRSVGAVNQAAVQAAVQQYQYGRSLEGVDEAELSRVIWEKAGMRVTAGCLNEINELKGTISKQEKEKVETEAKHQKELEDKDRKFETAWNNREEQYNKAFTDQKNDYEQKLKDTKEESDRKLKDTKEECDRKLEEQKKEHKSETDKLKIDLANKDSEWEPKVAAEKERAEQIQKDLNEANGRATNLKASLDKANATNRDLEGQLAIANTKNKTLASELSTANNEKTQLEKRAKEHEQTIAAKDKTIESKDKEIHSLSSRLKQATGQTPVRATMIFGVPVPNICLVVMGIITAVALVIGGVAGLLIGKGGAEPVELATVQILAKNNAGEQLDGTSFTIVDAENNEVAQFATAANVEAIFELEVGTYTIRNVNVPDGYVPAEALSVNVTGENNSNIFTVVIPAEPVPTASIHVVARDENELDLTGVRFEILDAAQNVVAQLSLDSVNGTEVSGLPLGDYTIHCVEVPADYKLPEDITVTLANNGEKKSCIVSVVAKPQVWNDNGTINWDCVKEQVTDILTVEQDLAVMEEMLSAELPKAEGWTAEAMLLTKEWTPNEADALPPYVMLLRKTVSEDGAEPVEVSARDLLDKGCVVLEQGEYCMLVSAHSADYRSTWNKSLRAAVQTMDMLSAEEAQTATFCYMQEDGRVVDLHMLMTDAEQPDNWWTGLDEISFTDEDKASAAGKFGLTPGRTVSLVVKMENGTEGLVVDYVGMNDKGDELVAKSKENGRSSARVDDFVLVILK